ncbi:MAG: hypothetical protein M3Z66_06560 [Chloroflexota bacterium]|nr:hypothetical protein [Chloroflexota bacterium]
MNQLPTDATAASRRRLDLARILTDACPPELGREIALTGSAARGRADDFSDIEVNLWVEQLPHIEQWSAWLETMGATDIRPNTWDADTGGFHWTVCRFGDIWAEVGWATLTSFSELVRGLAAGEFAGTARLEMAWTVAQAIPLRTEGALAKWQAMLAHYPDGLAQRIVANQTTVWADPHVPGVRWALAARGERMALAMRFLWDMQNLLRVLFAINHRWDQDLKWTDQQSLDLPLKPDRLSARIDEMFTLTDLKRAVEVNQRLIAETLELTSAQGYDVAAALHSVREGLRIGLAANRP